MIIEISTMKKPDGKMAKSFKSRPFIPFIPTTRVRGNKKAAKIVSVLIVSLICNEMFAI